MWRKTELGGPAVTSTANSYSLCTVHARRVLLTAALDSADAEISRLSSNNITSARGGMGGS